MTSNGANDTNVFMRAAKRERIPAGKVLLQLIIDADLRRTFKAKCVEVDATMGEQLERLIRDWLHSLGKQK